MKHAAPPFAIIAASVTASALLVAGCAAPAGETPAPAGLANPASEHCVKAGGRLEIRDEQGGQTGYCHLPDGRVVEEWAFFRERNPN